MKTLRRCLSEGQPASKRGAEIGMQDFLTPTFMLLLCSFLFSYFMDNKRVGPNGIEIIISRTYTSFPLKNSDISKWNGL